MENSKSSTLEDEKDEVHSISSNSDTEPQDQDAATQKSNEHILLTSRRAKKRVTIHEDSTVRNTSILEIGGVVDNLENNFMNGVEKIRNALEKLQAEKQSFELHIRSLEEALKNSASDKEKCLTIIDKQENEIKFLKAELGDLKMKNEALQGEYISLQSDHEDHMNSIADQHRRKLVAKRTLRKWKGKLKNKELTKSQIYKIMEENEKLKKELLIYQKSTKDAFLRSANVLNTEALSLFQNTASRLVNLPLRDDVSDDSEMSDVNSTVSNDSSVNFYDGRKIIAGKDNKMKSRSVTNNMKRSFRHEKSSERPDKTFSDIANRNSARRPVKSYSDNEIQNIKSRNYSHIGNFAPDPLRRETREIMKQLECIKNPYMKLSSEKYKSSTNACHLKSHVHICHCAPLPGHTGSCPYCYPNENINFHNFPNPSKQPPKQNIDDYRRKDNVKCVVGDKGRVIYKPSGSTVVVEKHLSPT